MRGDDEDGLDEEERERLEEIVNNLDRDVEMPPYDTSSDEGYSREYKEYREEEEEHQKKTRFEKLCIRMGSLLNISASESTQERLSSPLRLLGWDITPGMVVSAAMGVGFLSFLGWSFLFAFNMLLGPFIPTSVMLILLSLPIGSGVYTYYKPIYAARNKVIKSSGEMILAILYMVVYMRASPNLEGAVRFAALNLDGPIAKDLRGVLWQLEIGERNRIEDALEEYTRRWKGYNDDFLESLQLLKAAVNDPSSERRDELLQDAIDRILEGTQEKMKHYAQSLETPVMILNALGAMLPVLGMIMLPLVSTFMGDVVSEIHLILMFNVLLPGFLYWFMKRILAARPPTVASQPTSEEALPAKNRYTVSMGESEFEIPVRPIGVLVFFAVALYGIAGYISFPHVYPVPEGVSGGPGLFYQGESYNAFTMLLRSVSITTGLGLGIGVVKVVGNVERKEAKEKLSKIEKQFPAALFDLGNKISGGTPIEVALEEAAESTSELEISELFELASRNIRDMGMTFESAVFDPDYGAVQEFPSSLIHTVMRAVIESSEKGTKMVSMAMITISRYLDNIHSTQENLNDLMDETTTSIQMLSYLLAPVVSGVAVGMSQTIIIAMYRLSSSFQEIEAPSAEAGTGSVPQYSGLFGNINAAIPPEVLQFVVGIYLIQLLWILGTFYMKILKGEDKTYRDIYIGKVLISGMLIYVVTLLTVTLIFGGVLSGIQTTGA